MVYETIALPLSYAGSTIGIISRAEGPSTGESVDGLAIAASLTEIAPVLEGAALRMVSQPESSRFVLRFFRAGDDIRLVLDLGTAALYRISRPMQNPPQPTAFVMLLRKHLRGTRVIGVRQLGLDRSVTIELARHEGGSQTTYAVVADLLGAHGDLYLICNGVVVRSLREDARNRPGEVFSPLPPQEKHDPRDVTPDLLADWIRNESPRKSLVRHVHGIGHHTAMDLVADDLGDDPPLALCLRIRNLLRYVTKPNAHLTSDGGRATFYPLPAPAAPMPSFQQALDRAHRAREDEGVSATSNDTLHGLKSAARTKARTLQKLRDWLDQADQADAWQAQADLLMTYASSIASGLHEVTLTDPASGEAVSISLDPSLSPRENAQRLYERAKRLRRGHPHVQGRLTRVAGELELLTSAIDALDCGEAIPSAALDLLRSRRSRHSAEPVALPFRRFEAEGFAIWVGKSARQNDALLRAASPNDLWLHVRDHAGSHVVVRTGGRSNVPKPVVEAAARLAARHSKASTDGLVDVMITQVKHVRKPKGAPPGLASVRVSDTLTVNMEEGGT